MSQNNSLAIDLAGQFMLKEYERIADLVEFENSRSDQRINIFLTITAAVAGAAIVIPQVSSSTTTALNDGIIAVLVVLFLFGLTIINRLVMRRVQLAEFHKSLSDIQTYFASFDPQIADYINNKVNRKQSINSKPIPEFIARKLTGGLYDFMVLSNSLIAGAIGLIFCSKVGLSLDIGFAIMAGITLIMAAILYHWRSILRSRIATWDY